MKVCKKCGRTLEDSMFNLVRKGSTALRSECKDCVREYQKEYLRKKKDMEGEKQISKLITKNAVDNIFSITNLKDIPSNIRKTLKLPKKLLDTSNNNFTIRSNIMNVMRRSRGIVHISQIQIAYYRMFNEFIKSRPLSVHLSFIKKKDNKLINPSKGYYTYKREV